MWKEATVQVSSEPGKWVASALKGSSAQLSSLSLFWMSVYSQTMRPLFWTKPDQVGCPSTQRLEALVWRECRRLCSSGL